MRLDYSRILGRAWNITWRYRALWLFGILLALFAGGGSGGGGGNFPSYSFNGRDFSGGAPSGADWSGIAPVLALLVIGLILLAIVFALLGVVARYLSQTALIRMVNSTEDTGRRLGWRDGFRLGWSRASFRLFLLDLVVGIPTAIAFVLLFLLAASPLLLWLTQDRTVGIIGTIAAIGLFILVVLLAIAVALSLSLLMPFFYRKAVLDDLGVMDSIREGYRLVRRYLRQAGFMWLIMVGIQFAYGIALIPVAIVLGIVAALIAGLPAVGIGALLNAAWGAGPAWVAGLLIGIPLFVLIFGVPLLFIGGLWEVFQSTTWTLTYRELTGIGGLSDSGMLPGGNSPMA